MAVGPAAVTAAEPDCTLLLCEAAWQSLSPTPPAVLSLPSIRVLLAAGSSAAAHTLSQQPPVFCCADPLRSARLEAEIER